LKGDKKIGSRGSNSFAGGYSPEDGTIEFYARIKSLLNVDFELVLNVGAGKALGIMRIVIIIVANCLL
jgi:hypothetical protein